MQSRTAEQRRLYEAFMGVIEKRLDEKGWSDADLNRAAGYSHPYINKVRDRESVPKLEHLQRLAKALDIDPISFVNGPENIVPAAVGAAMTLLEDVDLLDGALKIALPAHGLSPDRSRQVAATAVAMMKGLKAAGVAEPSEEHWRLAAQLVPA